MRVKYFKRSPSVRAYFTFNFLNVQNDFAVLLYISSKYFIPQLYPCEYIIVLPSTLILLSFHKSSCL